MRAKTIKTTWKLLTYDVWGNAEDGFEVNEVCSRGKIELTLRVQVANEGSMYEFAHAFPSDYQLQQVFGIRGAIDRGGDDTIIYVNRALDGYPLGQLELISHDALSPISWERNDDHV